MERKDPAIFRSVRNTFLFGRGGTRNLKCIYKFEGQRGERIRIKLRKVTTLNRPCMSRVDEDINRSFCYGDTNARIEVSDFLVWYSLKNPVISKLLCNFISALSKYSNINLQNLAKALKSLPTP